jgi:hypothetical protein
MEGVIQDNGSTTACMEEEFTHGLMEESMMEAIFKTKKKDRVNIHG